MQQATRFSEIGGKSTLAIQDRLDWKLVGQILAAAGVVLSLLFVGYEIRQNTSVARTTAAQAFTQQIIDLNAILVTEGFPELNARMADGELRRDFTSAELLQIDVTHLSLLRIWESLYRAVQEGIVDEDLLDPVGGAGPSPFSLPYFTESWPSYRGAFTEDFALFFEVRLGL